MNVVIHVSSVLPLHLPFRESQFIFRYCQLGFIQSDSVEIQPLLNRTVPSGVGGCCEALISVGVQCFVVLCLYNDSDFCAVIQMVLRLGKTSKQSALPLFHHSGGI